ncbi:pentatricopeptide repeat-containing protein At2g06000-like [Impatiens glandulifera]|uniref:pentatricopeptide repeat-containing protein At2g06000-like n=1 Tax=Impatiens glandulifera TaxID=253017 RepID=UPI001FB132B6|nr:pentatricopeptide repeat-containing protein At2g06000-like [Impatiens glandulifera]XP_047318408.1 pentatricopeptide repeat-containing protein At2g06000-like [Impatiens glandulifera]XP_047318409.1 pentatricopeptide repeat-containing protein At2g06000-like [Impatiens glandulifera]
MRLLISNHWIRRYFRYPDSIHHLSPTEPKVVSDISFFHVHTDVWFVKVICTICYRYLTKSIDSPHFNYLRRNLTSSIAFEVIDRLNDYYKSPQLAFKFLEFTKQELNLVHSLMTYHLLIKSLCQLSQLDSAQVIFEYMRQDGYSPNNWTLGLLISSFVNAGKFDIAKDLLIKSQSVDTVIRPVVYNNLLNALVKKNHVDEAVQFFIEQILNSEYYYPDVCSFNIVIQGLCTIGDVEKAFQFFNDMGKFSCWPDDRTYNILINGFCRINRVDRAHALLRQMQSQNGISPDAVSYTSLISGYCRLGKTDVSFSIFEEMISSGVKPSLITFNILINGFSKKGEMSSSMQIYEKMLFLGCFPDVVTLTSLIDGHCRSGEIDCGVKLFDEMKARNLYPNGYTFSIIINALCRENRLSEARDLLRELNLRKDIVARAFIYNPVIDGYCKAGNVDEANEIVSEMEENRCRADKLTFTILIIGHCVKGRMLEAIDIFNKMLAIGCNPDRITVNSLITLLLKAGKPNEAFRIMETTSEVVSMKTNINIPVAA